MDLLVDYFATKYGLPLDDARMVFALVTIFFGSVATIALPLLALHFYRKKRQHDHITYSVNELDRQDDGTTLLRIRTAVMLPKDDILTNNWLLNLKLRAARRRCYSDQQFIIMSKHDMDMYQPSIISAFSTSFAEGIMADLAGMEVKKCDFLLASTYETYENGAPFKHHVMVVRECDLEKFDDPKFCESICFERSHHADRVTTLKAMLAQRRHELSHTTVDDVRVVRLAQGTFRV